MHVFELMHARFCLYETKSRLHLHNLYSCLGTKNFPFPINKLRNLHSQLFSHIPGLYPVDVTSSSFFSPVVTNKNISTYCQMSSGRGEQNGSWLGTSGLEGLIGNLVILNVLLDSNANTMESVNYKAKRKTTNQTSIHVESVM